METDSFKNFLSITEVFDWQKIFLLILGFFILFSLVKIVNRFGSYLYHKSPSRRILFLQTVTIFSFVIYILGGFFLFHSVLDPPQELMIALGGSAAVAIGFAFKDIAASLIAGLIILFDRPFQVGDRVRFGEVYGEIKSINLRTVRLLTLDDNLVTIPNSKFINEYVASGNAGALDMMIVIDFHTSLNVNIEKVQKLLFEIAVTSRFVYLKKPVKILISEAEVANRLAIRFRVKLFVLDAQYEKDIETDIVTRVSNHFQINAIERPNFL